VLPVTYDEAGQILCLRHEERMATEALVAADMSPPLSPKGGESGGRRLHYEAACRRRPSRADGHRGAAGH
jgi:hypothetical protein